MKKVWQEKKSKGSACSTDFSVEMVELKRCMKEEFRKLEEI